MIMQIHLAELLDEPADKTVLITRANGIYTVYERDDKAASDLSDYEDERWFDVSAAGGEPATWRTALNYAEAVFPLGSPLAGAHNPQRKGRSPMAIDRPLPSSDIHGYFGLTRDDYLVRNRTFLQGMPPEWQNRFVACLRELDDAFAHVEKPQAYTVQPATQHEIRDLSDEELVLFGYSRTETEESTTYYDERGREVSGGELVMVPVDDPVPHYRHARIEPNLPAKKGEEAL